MRLWSLHPKYLDSKGLVALWREGLLAQKVISDSNAGYHNHSQLIRFKECEEPSYMISLYLRHIWQEAIDRNYNFNKKLINTIRPKSYNRIPVTLGQKEFELNHLLTKLETRDIIKYQEVSNLENYELHPLFKLIEGDIEPWEKI